MADRARLRDTGPDDTQPDGLAAFLAGAEYHILHVGEIPHDASESLIAVGCYYGPRLFAAVEKTLDLAAKFDTEDAASPAAATYLGYPVSRGPRIRETISRELLRRPDHA